MKNDRFVPALCGIVGGLLIYVLIMTFFGWNDNGDKTYTGGPTYRYEDQGERQSYKTSSGSKSTSNSGSTGRKSSSGSSGSSKKSSDPFDAKDYDDPDDFYFDYPDDFVDYDDAADYWEEHH